MDARPDAGDRINDEALARFRAMPIAEVRARFRTVSGELRGYLTVVPESRWIKHATHQEYFFGETHGALRGAREGARAILEAVS